MFLPATIGEDQPRPGRVAVHSILDVFDHLSGRLALMAEGFEAGPRKPGQSGSAAKAEERTKSDATTQFMVLLDYESGGMSRQLALDRRVLDLFVVHQEKS